jgi:anti-anti-sigma factor
VNRARPFEIRSDAEGVLWLFGELDLAQVDAFRDSASANVDGQREVVLEMSALTFLDSSGIRAILQFGAQVPHRAVVIRNPPDNVRRVLAIAGIDERTGVRIEP